MTQTELDEFIADIPYGNNVYFKINDDELVWIFRKIDGISIYYCRYSKFKRERTLYSEFMCGPDEFLDKLTLWKLSN